MLPGGTLGGAWIWNPAEFGMPMSDGKLSGGTWENMGKAMGRPEEMLGLMGSNHLSMSSFRVEWGVDQQTGENHGFSRHFDGEFTNN